jgi:sulfonate transport system substrate-binding protein
MSHFIPISNQKPDRIMVTLNKGMFYMSKIRSKSLFTVATALMAVAAAIFLTACSGGTPATKKADAEVVLKVGNQKGTVKALMTAAGVLQDAPYKIEWSEFPAAQHLLEGLNAGAVDVGLVGDAPYLFAFANGSKLQVVSALTYGTGKSTAIVVPGNSAIHSLSDLRGKRIATGKISIGHYLVLRALEKAGLTTKDVNLVFLAPSDAKAALAAGSVDAWSTWSPFLTTAIIQDKNRVLVNGEGLLSSHAYQVATPEAIADKNAQLRDFLYRLDQAYAWGAAHPEAYATALSKDTGLPPDVAIAMVRESQPAISPLDEHVVADAQDVLTHLSTAGDTQSKSRPINDAFATEFRVTGK